MPSAVNPIPTTVVDDVLLATAETAKQVALDNMERIASTANVSGPKYDNTHRQWFSNIFVNMVGQRAFDKAGLDFSYAQLALARQSRWATNRARWWVPCERDSANPGAPRYDR